jgi:hypothetical protein
MSGSVMTFLHLGFVGWGKVLSKKINDVGVKKISPAVGGTV